MRKIQEILRLKYESGLSRRAIASALNIGYGTVINYLSRAKAADIGWPLAASMDERTLGRLLLPSQRGSRRFSEPDHANIHLELKQKGVTLLLLWQEYRQCHPEDGYSYAQFCHRYRVWRDKQKRSMRQTHLAGEKLFVDYCGPTLDVINPDTGEVRTRRTGSKPMSRPFRSLVAYLNLSSPIIYYVKLHIINCTAYSQSRSYRVD